jgi:outer membrane lipoprotein-sorting protein
MTKGRIVKQSVAALLAAGWLLLGPPAAEAQHKPPGSDAQHKPPAADTEKPPSGAEIMAQMAQNRQLAGSEAIVEFRVTNEKGETRKLTLKMATKLYPGEQTEKRIYRFLEPEDVKGTGVLVFDHEKKADDIWLFLPEIRKVRRIVGNDKSEAFMGSEFTYGDLNIPPLDDYTYKLLGEENQGGEKCYKVEVLPKPGTKDGYKKKIYWVSEKSYAVRRGLYYDMSGKLLKELLTQDIKLLDEKNHRYRTTRMEMINHQNHRRSVFVTRKVAFRPNAKDDFFTTRFLERT